MQIRVFDTPADLGAAAAHQVARTLRNAVDIRGRARLVAATGTSQFAFLDALVVEPGVDWARVELFHLDEYIGLAADHPASFRRYLRDRLIDRVGVGTAHLIEIPADAGLSPLLEALGHAIASHRVDVAVTGIGENGHLAFNEPPADFETEDSYLVVSLNETSRRQQVSEGWFADLAQVPDRAVTMSVRQILKARAIVCLAPGARKAAVVRECLTGPVRPGRPASILRDHPNATLYLDRDSAALVSGRGVELGPRIHLRSEPAS